MNLNVAETNDSKPLRPPYIQHSDGRIQRGSEHDGGEIDLPLTGGSVDRCCIDYALTLLVAGDQGKSWTIRIEGQLSLADKTGPEERIRIHEGKQPGDVNRPINALLHRELERATIGEDGALRLAFSEGVTVEVPSHEHYEAWQVTGPDQATWVGGPSGTVAIFEPLT